MRKVIEYTEMGRAAVAVCSRFDVSAWKSAAWVVLTGAIACLLSAVSLLTGSEAADLDDLTQGMASSVWLLFAECASAAVFEELLFRFVILLVLIWGLKNVWDASAGERLRKAGAAELGDSGEFHSIEDGLDGIHLDLAEDTLGEADLDALLLWRAVVGQAALFGLVHVSGSVDAEFLARFAQLSCETEVVVVLQGIAKTLQAGLFGMLMALIVLKTGSICRVIVLHFTFDFLYFAPTVVLTGEFPSSYLTGSAVDLAIVLTSVVLLLPPCARSARALRCA